MTAQMSEHNKVRYAVLQSLRAIAVQWDRRAHISFTGHEVAEGLRLAADALEEKIKKETTIITPLAENKK